MSNSSTSHAPGFSVVIAHHEQPAWLGDAVRSALDQRAGECLVEVIVVDDGSDEGTRAALARWRDGLPEADRARLRWIERPRGGQASAWYHGVGVARGDFIAFLDADDRFHPDKLGVLAEAITQWPGLSFLVHDLWVRDESADRCLPSTLLDLPESLRERRRLVGDRAPISFPVPCGVVLRREAAAELLEAMPRDDWWQGADGTLNLAAWLTLGEVGVLGRRLGTYRVHEDNHYARIRDGRLGAAPRQHRRMPKRLAFLERLVDSWALTPEHRRAAEDALASRARQARQVSTALQGAWPGPPPVLPQPLVADQDPWIAVRAAFSAGAEPMVHLVGPNDRVHPWFPERMAHHLATQAALVAGCDFSLHDAQGRPLVHHALARRERRSPGHLAWRGFPQGHPWPFGPLASLVFKRSELLDAWAAHCDRRASAHARRFVSVLLTAGAWALGGAVRVDETWVSVEQRDADPDLHLREGEPLADPVGPLPEEGFAWLDLPVLLLGFVIESDEIRRKRLPSTWVASLGDWAARTLPAPLSQRLAGHAQARLWPALARRLAAGPVRPPDAH